MDTFRFLNFPVYQKAKNFYREILHSTNNLAIYSLRDQIRRASLSIVLNIAEGSARKSDKEFVRFLQLSLGSVNEVVACLDMMLDNQMIGQADFSRLNSNYSEIAKQLGGLFKKVSS